jgi:hypothetical protein
MRVTFQPYLAGVIRRLSPVFDLGLICLEPSNADKYMKFKFICDSGFDPEHPGYERWRG